MKLKQFYIIGNKTLILNFKGPKSNLAALFFYLFYAIIPLIIIYSVTGGSRIAADIFSLFYSPLITSLVIRERHMHQKNYLFCILSALGGFILGGSATFGGILIPAILSAKKLKSNQKYKWNLELFMISQESF